MTNETVSMLERQVRRVRRRLFLQESVNTLVIGWLIAAVVTAAWLLARPYVLGVSARPWMDWAVGGGSFVLASALALAWAARRTPGAVDAALSLDERFQLRERVSTTLTLSPELLTTSAGQALLSDAQNRIQGLDVGAKFPVRLGWRSALVPVACLVVALIAIFYNPAATVAQADPGTATPVSAELAKALEEKKQEYLQKPKTDPAREQRLKNPDIAKIEAKLQEILKKPMTTNDEVKDRLAEITSLEEQMKKKEKDDAERIESFKDQLKKLDRLAKKDKPQPGEDKKPGEDLRNALEQGDTQKAKEEADRLAKKIKNDELSKKDQDHLKKEIEDLKNDLQRLKREREEELKQKQKENEERRQEREKQLEQQRKEGKLDKEQFEQEKKKIDEERKQEQKSQQEQKQDLDQLAKKLERCEQCMKNGDKEGAAQALQEAAEQLDKQQQAEQQLEDLQNELQRMQDLREGMAKACDKCNGREGQEGDAETLSRRKDGDGKQGSGLGKGGIGKGRRPESKTGDTRSIDAKEKTAFDKKGAKIHVGTAGQAEKVIGKSSVSLQGEIKQASQDVPEAVETQRIPRGYKDSTKGYFKNIGGQKTGENVPMPPK